VLPRRAIAQHLMGEVGVVAVDPGRDGEFEFEGIVPVVGLDDIFFDGAHHSFRIGVALGIGPRGKDLLDAQNRAGSHEAFGGRLAAVVRDE